MFSASFTPACPPAARPHRYAHGLTKLDDIVRAVHGRAIGQHLMPDGRMMALFASEADFAPVHAALQHKASVHVSARNAPKALTLRYECSNDESWKKNIYILNHHHATRGKGNRIFLHHVFFQETFQSIALNTLLSASRYH